LLGTSGVYFRTNVLTTLRRVRSFEIVTGKDRRSEKMRRPRIVVALVALAASAATACDRADGLDEFAQDSTFVDALRDSILVRRLDAMQRHPVAEAKVRSYGRDTARIPNKYRVIAKLSFVSANDSLGDAILQRRALPHAAKLGANAIGIVGSGRERDVIAIDVGSEVKDCPGRWITAPDTGERECQHPMKSFDTTGFRRVLVGETIAAPAPQPVPGGSTPVTAPPGVPVGAQPVRPAEPTRVPSKQGQP
jgi:hypothetical protein